MSDASGNRLPKSGKLIVTSVDLKVQDAKTKRFHTFRPTFEVAYLRIDEMLILGYDWFSETTEHIVVGPPNGLEFKSPIQEIVSKTEEFNNVIREAAFVGVIRINQQLVEGQRLMSISVSNGNKLLMENVPLHNKRFEKVFGKEMQSELPKYNPQDIAINLLLDAKLPAAKLYPMSQDELQLLREYIDEMLANGKIQPGSGALGYPVFFVKEKTGKIRLVVDYQELNAITIKDSYPIPLITILIKQIQNSTWFTKLDLKNGFNLIRVKEGDE